LTLRNILHEALLEEVARMMHHDEREINDIKRMYLVEISMSFIIVLVEIVPINYRGIILRSNPEKEA
jgi:hypothetical protein